MEYLTRLNEAQKKAVLATEGPVLVLAGAGAGKTRTIAHRIVHIVKGGTPPHLILAITFTNKAAREMRERVLDILKEYGERETGAPTVTTFHALSAMLLREYAEEAGVPRNFTIYDRTDSLRAVKHVLRELGQEDKRFEPRAVLSAISRAKGEAVALATYQERYRNAWYQSVVADVWARYDATLRKEKALDFDDLIFYTWRLLSESASTREALNRRFRYTHVDEYQDTNIVQYEIARLLAGPARNLFCVGDIDQNIYTFRGATIENILHFERSFPNATVLRLEENYRSTGTIVEVSNDIIKKNKRRREKTAFTENPKGEKISLLTGYDERSEAEQVATTIECLRGKGVMYGDIAVLYRANFQSRVLEDAMLASGVPYRVLGTRFFDRKEVKDTLSYLRAAQNPDSETDVRRTINEPARGIGKVSVDKLFGEGIENLSATTRRKVDDFFVILSDIHEKIHSLAAHEAIAYTLERSGILASLGTSDEDTERLENVRELVSLAATRYSALPAPEGIERLLEDAALATDQDELDHGERGDAVALMTVHASKGLEFSHVFITGLEEGLFPHERMDTRNTAADDEEERRLFYVALTRAKQKVYLTYAQVRTVFGKTTQRIPSPFLLDIDEKYLETDNALEGEKKVVYLD